MPNHEGPPLMLNRGFLEQKDNIMKLLEIIFGIITAFMNNFCYPNSVFLYCSGRIFSTTQLFQIMVINIFCAIMTILLTMANLLGFYDAFYRYNFPLLERFLMTLFAALYSAASIASLVEFLSNPFSGVFVLPLLFTLWTTAIYVINAHLLWKNREKQAERW